MLNKSLFIILLLVPGFAFSQSTLVTTAVIEYDQGNYLDAIAKCEDALKRPELLKEKQIAKAWLYLGKSRLKQLAVDARENNKEALLEHENYVLEACDDFEKSYSASQEVSSKKSAESELKNIFPYLLQSAIQQMNYGSSTEAQKYLDRSKKIEMKFGADNAYMLYDLSGQNYLALADSTQAFDDLRKAIQLYEQTPPKYPDFLIGYAYYRIALIQYYRDWDVDGALNSIQTGLHTLEKENNRRTILMADPEVSEDPSLKTAESDYLMAKSDLQRFELEVYLNNPAKYDEALLKFKKAIEEDPKNEAILIAYASLLERSDTEGGYAIYLRVLELNPDNATALFNAGANRVNKAVGYARLANEELDYETSTGYQKQMDVCYKEALPHMERHHQLNPSDKETLRALTSITIALNLTDKYQMYKEKLNGL